MRWPKIYANRLVNDKSITSEDKGKCYNLLGLIEIQFRNNHTEALKYFNEALKYYELTKSYDKILKIQGNIGNIYYLSGDKINAERYWNNSLELNRNIGNLAQEALVLLSYGVFYQENHNYEMAIQYWSQSETIFSTIGYLNGKALSINNLGEMYLETCEYQNSFDNLNKALSIFKDLNNIEEEFNTLFLLGKFWFIIGDPGEIYKVIGKYEYHFNTVENLSEKFRINYDYLKVMKNVLDGESSSDNSEFLRLIEKCKELDESNLYVEIILLYVDFLIEAQKFDESLKYLNDDRLIKQIENSILFRAQKEFLLGKIAQLSRNENLKSPIDYFESAYSLIEDQSVNELTWKVLFAMSEIFWERGNINKSKKPRLYAIELLNMIADHISNSKIRNAYIERIDRKIAFEKLKLMNDRIQQDEYQKS